MSQGTLGRVIVLVVVFIGLAMLFLIGGLMYLAITHDGEATPVVIVTLSTLVGALTGLLPSILHYVNQAAGTTASNTTVNNGPVGQTAGVPSATTTTTTTTGGQP